MTAQITNTESGQDMMTNDPAELRISSMESTPPETTSIEINTPPASTWRRVAESATDILADLPEYIGRFFRQNGSLMAAIGWLIVALLGLRVLSALIGTINSIPLLSPLFELVGLGYSIWFVNRYLLTSGKRQELNQEFSRIKQQILG